MWDLGWNLKQVQTVQLQEYFTSQICAIPPVTAAMNYPAHQVKVV